MAKTIEEINERIKKGEAVVLTADEMTRFVREEGAAQASKKVDVVTTGTFGPMCSSGAFINLGHSDPPMKMHRVWLNDVPVCADLAAVDIYIGATALSDTEGMNYGGGHLIEDLLKGKWLRLKASAIPTDCYPRREIQTYINLESVNEAFLFNPRNAYQNYVCATNGSDRTLYTYMGVLIPGYGNVTYSSAGALSPLLNDPYYRTIGVGTRVFLGGAPGYVAWHGTQHRPSVERTPRGVPVGPGGTLSLIADMKKMSHEFIRAARFHRYGVSLYVGIGVPIPILDEEMASFTGVGDDEIYTYIYDYSEPTRSRKPLKKVSYAELHSGNVEIMGKKAITAPISSIRMAKRIAQVLRDWIKSGEFLLTEPVQKLPTEGTLNTLEIRDRGEG